MSTLTITYIGGPTAVLEYERRAWSEVYGTPLHDVVQYLHARGYDAYFLSGDQSLIRLNGDVAGSRDGEQWWQRTYGATRWSNIWVSKRASACARKVVLAYAARTDHIPAACYA